MSRPENHPRLTACLRLARSRSAWLAVLGVALIPRLVLLAARPVWYDEAFAALFSAKGPAAMLYGTLAQEAGVAADVHPILYYTLLWMWQLVFGGGPLAIRSLSVLLGLAVVGLGYWLARELWGRETAFVAGLLLALSPFQVHYAQEARMYALLAALLLAATLVYHRAMRESGWRAWALFAVLAAAAQYAHNLAFVFLIPLAITPLAIRHWRAAAATALAGLGAAALYLPWLLRVPSQIARVEWAYWIAPPGPMELVRTLLVYLSGLPIPEWSLPLVLAAGLLLVVIATLSTVRALRAKADGARRGAWAAWLAAGPVLVMFLVSLWRPVYLDRALLPAGAMFALWIAWALGSGSISAPLHRTAWAGLVTAFAVGLVGFFTYRGFPYAPFQELDSLLRSERAAAEVVLHSNKITALPAVYAGPDLQQRYLADPPRSASDSLAPATQAVLGLPASADAASAVADAAGVWFVMFDREIEDYRAEGVERHPALAWLEAHFRLVDSVSLGELSVYHFVR
ncbi:MAG: hypothetical protein A2Y93_11630 [Chloroflexi bacterium RBG_13_68_17]|nr:MAG: hypothetical protein A2Y93_11630 [Chloroflexi bacterium RBG_13_68_17]